MTGVHYNLIQTGENPLTIEKDLLELQKTIIYYGELIRIEIDKLSTLIQKDIKERKEKTETSKIVIGQDYLLQHLSKLELPKE